MKHLFTGGKWGHFSVFLWLFISFSIVSCNGTAKKEQASEASQTETQEHMDNMEKMGKMEEPTGEPTYKETHNEQAHEGHETQEKDASTNPDTMSNKKEEVAATQSSFELDSLLQIYYTNALHTKSPQELRSALHSSISKNYTQISYKDVWGHLEQLYEDPKNPDNIILFYTGRSEEKSNKARRPGRKTNDYWNREHLWPQSHGYKKGNKTPKTDLHHIVPTDKTVNSSRGNKDFDNGGQPHKEAQKNKSDRNSWEARPGIKGDIARALFYMDIRYEKDPDLELIDSDDTSGTQLGKLCTLYNWHKQDPISQEEISRNNKIHNIQGNRNPFIDNPKWVDVLWASKCTK